MLPSETVHRYPRLLTWTIELFCTLIVLFAVVRLAALILRWLWSVFGVDFTLSRWIPFLPDLVGWTQRLTEGVRVNSLVDLVPALLWTALALLLAIMLRNAFPVVRTSSRGALVEFGGDWLPVPWEGLRTIKVTTDVTGERYVLLVQTSAPLLTGWHRLYSLLYSLSWSRGFWISSNVSDFDKLVRTFLGESERTARAEEHVQPVRLDESAQSSLFRLLLSPTSFFSSRAPEDEAPPSGGVVAPAGPAGPAELVRGTYPLRIMALVNWGSLLLAALIVWRYLVYWAQFLVLEVPPLRQNELLRSTLSEAALTDLQTYYATGPVPFLGTPGLPNLPAPLWLLVAAHLMVLLMLGVVAVLRNLFPALETRAEGLAVRVASGWVPLHSRWRVVPWEGITAVRASEFSEDSQIILLQTQERFLPFSYRINSLFYDGSFVPGVFVTSAMHNFELFMQRVLIEVVRLQDAREQAAEAKGIRPPAPVVQQEASSWLLRMSFKPGMTIESLVEWVCAETEARQLDMGWARRAARPMFWIALVPALFLLMSQVLIQAVPPGLGLLVGVLLIWFISMLEWPLVCLLAMLLDEAVGGEEGYRALYIYPTVQLPRVLPMLLALLLLVVGWPVFSILGWMGAIGFSVFLSAGLWEKLYNWKGSQLVLGGLLPAIWQFLVLFAYVLVQR